MGGYADPVNEDDNRPATALEAEAVAGAQAGFRGSYGGDSGRAAQNWDILQENKQREQEAREVSQTRREREQANQKEQQASGNIDYAATSRENVRNRPGYTDPDTIGDSRTRMMARLLGFDSENIPEAAQGVILESQRQKAYDTPTLNDDFFYGTQLEKWKQNKVELSSEYHHETLASGLQQKANPYEYAGDLALESLKGSPGKSSEYTSPSSGTMAGVLPGGRGLQEVMWDSAVARDQGIPQSERVSFMDSVRVLNAADGLYGSYGSLYGGKIDNRSAFDVLGAQKNAEAVMDYNEANAQAPFLAVGVTHREVIIPSEFDLMVMQANIPIVSGAAVATSDFLFGGTKKITIDTGRPVYGPEQISYGTPTTEIRELEDGSKIVTTNTPVFSTRSVFTPVTTRTENIQSGFDYGQSKFAEKITQRVLPEMTLRRTGTSDDYGIALLEGGYNELRNKPLTAAVNVGIGMAFVAGGGVVAGLGTSTVIATQGMRFIGPVARGANFFVNRAAPPILAGMYATDVAGRSTQGFADFSTESTKRLGGILTTETIPMIAGGMTIANRGTIVSGAKNVYGRAMENPPTFRGVRESVSDKIFEFRQGKAGIERLSPDSGTTFNFDVQDTTFTGSPRPAPTQPRLPSGGSTGGADVVFTPTPPKVTVSFTDIGNVARDDLIVTKATYAYRSKTPLYDMLTPKENVGVAEGAMQVTQKPENIIPEPRTTTVSAMDLTQPAFSREAPLWRKMTLENTRWVPESKEAGINYIKERYPDQAEIWSDYLTETQEIKLNKETQNPLSGMKYTGYGMESTLKISKFEPVAPKELTHAEKVTYINRAISPADIAETKFGKISSSLDIISRQKREMQMWFDKEGDVFAVAYGTVDSIPHSGPDRIKLSMREMGIDRDTVTNIHYHPQGYFAEYPSGSDIQNAAVSGITSGITTDKGVKLYDFKNARGIEYSSGDNAAYLAADWYEQSRGFGRGIKHLEQDVAWNNLGLQPGVKTQYFSHRNPLFGSVTVKELSMTDMALEYIQLKYPDQREIWNDYLTQTQKLDIKYNKFAKDYTGNPVEYSRGGEIGKFLDEAPAGWFRTEPQPTTRSVNIPDESRYAYMEYLQGSDVPLLETSRSVTTRPIWGTSRTTVTSARFEPEFVELSQITPGNRKSTIVFEREGMGSFGGVEAWTPSKTGTKTVTTRENVQINPYSGETMIWGDRTTVFTPSQPKLAVERFAGVINIFDLPPTVKVAGVSPEVPPVTAITKMSFKMGDIETGGNRVYNQYGELYESGKIQQFDLNKGTVGFVKEQTRTTEIDKAFSDMLEAPEPALSGISGYDKPSPKQGHQFDIQTVKIPQQPTETVSIPKTAKPKEFVRPPKAGGQQVFFEPTLQDRASVRIQDMFADINRDPKPVHKSPELIHTEARIAAQRTQEINMARFQKGFVSETMANDAVRVYYEPVPQSGSRTAQAQQQSQSTPPAAYMSPFTTIQKFAGDDIVYRQTYARNPTSERTHAVMQDMMQPQRQDDATATFPSTFSAMSGDLPEPSISNKPLRDQFITPDSIQSNKDKRKQGIIPAIDIARDTFTDQTPIIDQLNRQRIITDQDIIPRIDTQITPDIIPVTTPDIIPDITRNLPPIPPVILGGIGLPSSGSSGGGYSPEPRIVTWTFSNPVGAERLIADRGKKLKPMKSMGIKKFKPMPKF